MGRRGGPATRIYQAQKPMQRLSSCTNSSHASSSSSNSSSSRVASLRPQLAKQASTACNQPAKCSSSRRGMLAALVAVPSWLAGSQAQAVIEIASSDAWLSFAPAPEPIRFPRKALDIRFAVLLMRSTYDAVDDLDFIPMVCCGVVHVCVCV
jgi:hypothetical protein